MVQHGLKFKGRTVWIINGILIPGEEFQIRVKLYSWIEESWHHSNHDMLIIGTTSKRENLLKNNFGWFLDSFDKALFQLSCVANVNTKVFFKSLKETTLVHDFSSESSLIMISLKHLTQNTSTRLE